MKGVTKDVAIKIIHREFAPEVIREKFLPRELEIIQLLRHHQNIVKTILINQSVTTDYIVTELARRDLYDTVRIKGALRRVFNMMLLKCFEWEPEKPISVIIIAADISII